MSKKEDKSKVKYVLPEFQVGAVSPTALSALVQQPPVLHPPSLAVTPPSHPFSLPISFSAFITGCIVLSVCCVYRLNRDTFFLLKTTVQQPDLMQTFKVKYTDFILVK